MSTSKGEMPFLEHLEELRWRIIWSLLAVIIGSAIGIFAVFQFNAIDILTAPLDRVLADISVESPELVPLLGEGRLVFLNLTEPFFFAMKVGIALGFLLASPVVAYHVWAFFAPALEDRERRVIVPSMYLGLVLFAAGVAMAYFLVLPITIHFFVRFGLEWFALNLTADHYLAMVWRLLLVFGAVFELPVVVMILSALGLVTPAFLRAQRRHAIVVMAVVAAVLAPGDFVGLMLLLLIPLIALYELSIVLSSVVRRERIETVSLLVPLLVIYEARNRFAAAVRRRQRAATLTALLLTTSLIACGEAGDHTEASAGPQVDWTLTEELRIGAVDRADQNLTRVLGILPLPDGSVWILQSDDHQLRVYSAAGEFVRTVGQRGQAPGELLLPNGVGWWGSTRDTIWVKDNQRRVTLFTPDGAYARSFSWAPTPYLDSWQVGPPDVLLPDGSGVGLARKNPPAELLDSRLVRFDPSQGVIHQELARLRRIEAVRQTATTTLRLPIPYHELVAYSPDGSWFAVVDRAAPGLPEVGELPVHAISTGGDTLWSRTLTYQPVAIPQIEMDSILGAWTESRLRSPLVRGETRDQARAWVEEKVTFPGHRPPIQTAMIGQDGRLWLEWTAPSGGAGEWWVLDREGLPEGRIAPAQRIRVWAAERETIWALEPDSLDVPYVVRYHVGRARE